MITSHKTNVSLHAGETDCVLQGGPLNDAADGAAGNTIISGTIWMVDGTLGAIITIRVTSVGVPAGEIVQLEIQDMALGVPQTVATIAGLSLKAVRKYEFQIHNDAGVGNYDGASPIAMPNQSRILLTLTNKDDSISAVVAVQSTW